MSMICRLLGITEAQITALRAAPSLANDLAIVSDVDELMARFDEALKRMSPEQKKQFEARTRPVGDPEKSITEARGRLAALAPLEQPISIGKSWHMLHYLFTGHIGPANAPGDLLLTGEAVGADFGYGPPRIHSPKETRDFSNFLAALDLARLQARVDLAEMNRLGVYSIPFRTDAKHESELRYEVGLYFPLLRNYVRMMSEKKRPSDLGFLIPRCWANWRLHLKLAIPMRCKHAPPC